jgi:hypothetical protein
MKDESHVARLVRGLTLLGGLACQSPPTEPAGTEQVRRDREP